MGVWVAVIVSIPPTITALVALMKLFQVARENEQGHGRVEEAINQLKEADLELKAQVLDLRSDLLRHVKWEESDKWELMLGSIAAIRDRLENLEE